MILEDIKKDIIVYDHVIFSLENINLKFDTRGFYVITGPLEMGKTTLLSLINLTEKPTAGNLFLNDVNISNLKEGGKNLYVGKKQKTKTK